MKLSAILAPLLDAKAPHEQIMAVILAYEQQQEDALENRRAADASRQARKRERDKSRDVTLGHSDNRDEVPPKKETSPTPPKEKTTPSQSEANASSRNPRQALEAVLDGRRANDVIEHRQRIRKPLTVRAAELLAAQFRLWPDPNAAADAMVLNGWQGFKPEWMDRQRARGSPGQTLGRNGLHHFDTLIEEMENDQGRADGSDQGNFDDAVGLPVLTLENYRRHG